jgi:putative PEP-CTERM system TPR-repeat lipoprotein
MHRFRLLVVVIAFIGSACSKDPAAEKARFMKRGTDYFTQGKYAEALVEFRSAEQLDPNDGELRMRIAETYLRTGDGRKALDESVRAADLRPDDALAQLKAGSLLLHAARFDDARDRADKILEKDANNVDARVLKANALAGLKDSSGALTEIEDAIKTNPDRGATYANLGALQLRRGDRQAAEDAFKRAAELDPKSTAAQMALGNFYWNIGDFPSAEEHLKKAVEVSDGDPIALRFLACLYIATGRIRLAEDPLKRLADRTQAPEDRFGLAEYYLLLRNDEAARAILEPLERDRQTSAEAKVRLAAIDYRTGRRKEAFERLDAALQSDKPPQNGFLIRATLNLGDAHLDEALADVQSAIKIDPSSTPAHFLLGRIQTLRNQPDAAIAAYQEALRLNPRATDARIALAQLQMGQGDLDTAVAMARDALSADPSNADAQLLIAKGLVARREYARAAQELQQLNKRFPNSVAVLNELGMLAGHQGNAASARANFERVLALQPNNEDALLGLVSLELASGRPDVARKLMTSHISSNPTAPLLTLAARTYAASGDRDSAEKALKQAIDVDSAYLPAYVALGTMYVAQNQLEQAEKEFETLAEKSPKPEGARTMLGILKEARGDTTGAREQFERVLDANPEAAVAANNLAWILSQTGGNLDVALDLAKRAAKNLPDFAPVNHTLGTIYLKKDLKPLSIAAFSRAVEEDEANPTYHFDLGRAYASSGDVQHARQSLSRALELNPKFAGADEARRLLITLKT